MTGTKTIQERILEARKIACEHTANGNEVMAELWNSKVDRLLDQLGLGPAA